MNARVEALIEQARHLNRDECLVVLDVLQELVSPPDAAWEAAWAAESEDRLAAYERGDIEAEEFDVAMERLRREFLVNDGCYPRTARSHGMVSRA